MNYTLLATDMDGTLLNTQKEITPRTANAIHQALAQGYEVLVSTGRCPAEIKSLLKQFPEMRYAICNSGATVTDLRSGKDLSATALDPAIIEQVLAAARGMEVAIMYYIGNDLYGDTAVRGRLDYYNCDCYHRLFEDCAVWTDDLYGVFQQKADCVRKMNLFFHSAEEYARMGEALEHIPVNHPSGIPNNYEISPAEVSKGTGLKTLCDHLGISMDETIACGDEGNDREIIMAAGLGVAMGNATEDIRAVADVVVADCDHDGVAEAIETYLGKPVMKVNVT